MQAQNRRGVEKVGGKIPIGDGIQAVEGDAGEAQIGCQHIAIDRIGGSGQRRRP